MTKKTILVLGSGGREHALATRLAASHDVGEVVVAPGNGGTAREHRNAPIASLEDPIAVARLAAEIAPDLVVVGPEAPLVAGVADALREAGFFVFGPSQAAARLEGSKAFFKEFATRHRIPTAAYEVFDDAAAAHAFVDRTEKRLVVKADGLCAGKGVVVARDRAEAHDAIERMLVAREFGEAGARIVIEEAIEGAEASVHVLTDGKGYLVLPAAQDHKRVFDGDQGPNTGGMGAYAPAPLVTDAIAEKILRRVVEPTVHGLYDDKLDYRGVVFAGIMITPAGDPMVLEYNVRFGDPETEVLMPVLDEDVLGLMTAIAKGDFKMAGYAKTHGHAAAVVLAAQSYPAKPRTGDPITGLEEAEAIDGVYLCHAGTRQEGERLVTSGGRVLAVTAIGETLRDAVDRAYAGCSKIRFDGMHYRRDIAARALGR